MGLFSFLQRRGTVPEICTWVAMQSLKQLEQTPDIPSRQLFVQLVERRFAKKGDAAARAKALTLADTVRGIDGLVLALLIADPNSEYGQYAGRTGQWQQAIKQELAKHDLPSRLLNLEE